MSSPLTQLTDLGQSVWYDFITRDLIQSGELARLIKEDSLAGHDVESDHLREGGRGEQRL